MRICPYQTVKVVEYCLEITDRETVGTVLKVDLIIR